MDLDFDLDECEQPVMIDEMCPDPRYDSRSLSNCITDLLVRCTEQDDDTGFSIVFDSRQQQIASSLQENESNFNQAQQFALDVLRSNPSSQSNSRSNSNQAEHSHRPSTAADSPDYQQQLPVSLAKDDDEISFLSSVASALGELPVHEISGSVQLREGHVSMNIKPQTERARELMQSRFEAIQLVRRTLRQVSGFCAPRNHWMGSDRGKRRRRSTSPSAPRPTPAPARAGLSRSRRASLSPP